MENSNSAETQRSQDKGKRWPQILAASVASLGPLTTGIHYAWSSPSVPYIIQQEEYYHITENEASYFTVLPPIAMVVSSVFCYHLTDYIGRKKTMMLVAVPHLLAWIIIIYARQAWAFYIARIMTGIADAAMFCTTPAYIGEISTPTVRGIMGNSVNFMMTIGEFGINLSGHFLDVRTTAYICIGIPLVYVICLSQMPDSPYYLLKTGNLESAKSAMTWLNRKNDIDDDMWKLSREVQRQLSETGSWFDLVRIKSNRRALLVGLFLRTSQQLSGMAIFLSYTQPVFEKTGEYVSPQLASDIFLGLFSIASLFGSFTVEKFGRRLSYFYTILICGVILFLLAIYFFIDHYQLINLASWKWIPLAGMILFIICYSLGVGVVPTLMSGELFSVSVKAKGLCVLVIAHGLSVFVSNIAFHQLTMHVGLYCPFLFFSLSCLISAAVTLHLLPETKGKTLEEIQQNLKKN